MTEEFKWPIDPEEWRAWELIISPSNGGTSPGGRAPRPAVQGSLLTVNDLCDLIRVAPTFVYRHAHELGGVKVGSHLRFRRDDVDAWLTSRKLQAHPLPRRLAARECQVDVDNGIGGGVRPQIRRKRRPA